MSRSQETYEYTAIAYDDEQGVDVRFHIREIETTYGKGHRQRKFSSYYAQPASLGCAQPKKDGVHVVPLGELPENWKIQMESSIQSEKNRVAELRQDFIKRYIQENGAKLSPSAIPDIQPDYSDIWIRMPRMHFPKRT